MTTPLTKLTGAQVRAALIEALQDTDAGLLDRTRLADDGVVDFSLCSEPEETNAE